MILKRIVLVGRSSCKHCILCCFIHSILEIALYKMAHYGEQISGYQISDYQGLQIGWREQGIRT